MTTRDVAYSPEMIAVAPPQRKVVVRPSVLIGRILTYAALIAYSIYAIFPLYWIGTLAFKTEVEIHSAVPRLWGFEVTLDNWREVLGLTQFPVIDFPAAMRNSLIIVPLAVLLALLLGVPVAYSLARYSFPGKQTIHFFYLTLYFMPAMLILIPLFVLYNATGLYNTYLGMVLILQLINLPLVVLIMRGFFDDLPVELEQSARVDGAKSVWIFWRVLLPLVRPGLVATAFLCTIFSWNSYVFSYMLTSADRQTAVVRLTLYRTFTGIMWGPMSAAILLTVLPVLVLAILIQRFIVRGLTLGAVKG